jgi:dolichol-phosphate mannosyltransferase
MGAATLVVIPTYDEAENVETAVRAVLARGCRPDVLVVDDGSTDGTREIVHTLIAEQPDRVDLLERSSKEGLGRAYAAAFSRVLATGRYDFIVQMDADGSHDPADVDRLVGALNAGDLALGSRYVTGGDVSGWSRRRELLSRGGNLYARLLLRTPVRDLTCGFKAWRATLLADVDAASTTSEGYTFQIEMTMRAISSGARIVEIPVVFKDRDLGHSKMSSQIAREALFSVPKLQRQHWKPTA